MDAETATSSSATIERATILIASSRVLHCGVQLEESTPIVNSAISIVIPAGTWSEDCASHLLVDLLANQLEEEGLAPMLTTMLIEFCTLPRL